MKTFAAFALIASLATSMSFSQTTAPKQPAAEKSEAHVLAGVLGSLTGQITVHSVRVRAAFDRVGKEKVLEFGTVKTKGDIAARRKIVDEYVAASKTLEAYLDGMERNVRTELATAKVSAADTEKFVADYMRGHNKTAAVTKEIVGAQRTSVSTSGEIYALLDAEWGNWSADKKGMLIFKKKPALDKLNALHKKIKDSVDKQDAAEKRLAETRGKK